MTPQPSTEPVPLPGDQRYPAEMVTAAMRFLGTAPIGSRLVARRRVSEGFTDAVGYLRTRDERQCTIETRRGLVTVPIADVVAAKEVPEPPVRRS